MLNGCWKGNNCSYCFSLFRRYWPRERCGEYFRRRSLQWQRKWVFLVYSFFEPILHVDLFQNLSDPICWIKSKNFSSIFRRRMMKASSILVGSWRQRWQVGKYVFRSLFFCLFHKLVVHFSSISTVTVIHPYLQWSVLLWVSHSSLIIRTSFCIGLQ